MAVLFARGFSCSDPLQAAELQGKLKSVGLSILDWPINVLLYTFLPCADRGSLQWPRLPIPQLYLSIASYAI